MMLVLVSLMMMSGCYVVFVGVTDDEGVMWCLLV